MPHPNILKFWKRGEKMNNFIKMNLPVTEILAGLAEEASELAQAALKLRRVFDKTNPTPKSEEEAIECLYEEIADVKLYLSMIDIPNVYIDEIMQTKEKRWALRLLAHDNNQRA